MNQSLRTLSAIILVAAVFTAAVWYLYAPALRAPFVFDDMANIVNNPGIRLTAVTRDNLVNILKSPNPARPLANASFALNYYIGRYDVAGYRLVNLAIHIFSALLVFLVARLTPGPDAKQGAGTAFLAAALWLVNPVHTQSVTYIVQRMNALSAMFVLLAMVCYITARRLQRQGRTGYRPLILLAGTALSGLCGLAAKETAAILPVLLLLYEWFFFQDLSRAWLKKQLAWIGPAALAAVVAALVLTAGHPFEKLAGMYAKLDFTPGQRLLTEPGVILYYLTLLLFPHPDRLNLDYDFPLSYCLVNPVVTLPAILALAALTAVAVVAAGKHRLYAFSVFWFLAALAIESSFLGLALIFEHRTYLPSVFPAIAAAHFLTRRIKPAPAGAIAVCLLIALCAWGTYRRNRVWADPLVFWQDTVRKSPDKAIPCNNLGLAYKEAGGLDNALFFLNKALRIRKEQLGETHPDVAESLSNIGLVYYRQGNFDQALACHQEALGILQTVFGAGSRHLFEIHSHIGLALDGKGDSDAALYYYQQALEMERAGGDDENLNTAAIYNNLGSAWYNRGDGEKALAVFHRALAIRIRLLGERHPHVAESFNNIGLAYGSRGDYETAIGYYRQALDIELETLGENHPMTAATYFNLGLVSHARGDYPQAVFYMRRVVDLYADALGRHHPYLETAASILNEAQRKSCNQNAGPP
ncbi:MAG: tetratricopeptide repeat protein [Thermodesulfobacteriota bacterium]